VEVQITKFAGLQNFRLQHFRNTQLHLMKSKIICLKVDPDPDAKIKLNPGLASDPNLLFFFDSDKNRLGLSK
jgi:hypothetical protein